MNRKKHSRFTIRRLASFLVVVALVSAASAEWNEKVLYSFQGLPDGSTPIGAVVFDRQGNLYGATQNGGSSSCPSIQQCGTVYQLARPAKQGDPWTETVLYIFKGNTYNDGASPYGGLVIDATGNLYGTTGYGGTGFSSSGERRVAARRWVRKFYDDDGQRPIPPSEQKPTSSE